MWEPMGAYLSLGCLLNGEITWSTWRMHGVYTWEPMGAYLSLWMLLLSLSWINFRRILWLEASLGLSGFSLSVQADLPKIGSRIFGISHNQQFTLIFKETLILRRGVFSDDVIQAIQGQSSGILHKILWFGAHLSGNSIGILWLGPYLNVNLHGILWLGDHFYVNLYGILWLEAHCTYIYLGSYRLELICM